MKVFNLQTGLFITALLASGGAFSGLGDHGWLGTEQVFAASAQQKAQARKALDQVIASLSGVDAAYASGKAAEAQAKLEEARSGWNEVSPCASGTRRARRSTVVRLSGDQAEKRRAGSGSELHRLRYAGGAKRRHRGRAEVGAPYTGSSSGSASSRWAGRATARLRSPDERSGDTRAQDHRAPVGRVPPTRQLLYDRELIRPADQIFELRGGLLTRIVGELIPT